MVKADPNAGIIYILQPQQSDRHATSRADIEWALANKPAGSILLLDEAYIHLSKAWENRGSDLVAADKEVMILRTFSKLYGMAGLRAGYAMAVPTCWRRFPAGARAQWRLPPWPGQAPA